MRVTVQHQGQICHQTEFAGEPAAGTCPDCGHMIMAHVGTEACVVCQMEYTLTPEWRRRQARIQGTWRP
jgi:hypothetical protein